MRTRPVEKPGLRRRLGVASPKEMKDKLLAGARGETIVRPGDPKLWVGSVEALMRVLTPENRELLSIIRREKPESLSALAARVGREQGNVSRSIGNLERYGLVRLVARGRQKRPEVPVRRLKIEWDLETGALEVV